MQTILPPTSNPTQLRLVGGMSRIESASGGGNIVTMAISVAVSNSGKTLRIDSIGYIAHNASRNDSGITTSMNGNIYVRCEIITYDV